MAEKKQLRVCVFGPGKRFLSGISYYTIHLANALARFNSISVILMRHLLPTRLYPGRERVGANLTQLEYDPEVRVFDGVDWYWLPSILRALVFLVRVRPDVVVFQWWSGTVLHSYVLLASVARLLGARVVIEFHEVLDPGEAKLRLAQFYVQFLAPLMVRLAHGFVVHSEYTGKQVQQRYKLRQRPIALIHHGPYNQYRTDHKEHLARIAPAACCNLLFFGLIRPYKGLDDLIRAFDALPENEVAGYWLTIVGETWEGWNIPAELIARSRYRDRITFVNRYISDTEVTQFFAEADAIVLPYNRASTSGALHIAMSCGLPVVLTNVGGLVEAVADYDGAILVSPNDPIALHGAMQQVAKLRGKRYNDPHSWEHTATSYQALFDALRTPPGVKSSMSQQNYDILVD